MTGLKVLALAPLVAVTELPIDGIEKMGLVAILLVGIVALWRDSGKRADELKEVIRENTKAMTSAADTSIATQHALETVKEAILTCRANKEK